MSLPDFLTDRIAGEIRQQMEGVRALAQQLGRQRLSNEGEACVAGIGAAADVVSRLLAEIMDLQGLARNDIPQTLEPVRLREVMDEIEARWRPRAAMAGVTLLVGYDGDPDAVGMADRNRLLQVFDGFIGEAVAAQGRGAVEAGLYAYPGPEFVRLEGRIRGPRDTNWDEKDAETRVRSIADRLGLDVAIGAMMSRRIIARMNGELRKEANAGASDTVAFEMRLPLAVEATPEPPQEEPGRAAHILVVDDNATNRMVAQSLVEMFDCTSEAAEDGDEAVEAARSGRFDLILMDIRMPRMDGVSATRAIRALPGAVGATPIIALTANADPEDAEGYLAAGMNGVVEKPMKPEHLLAALQQALDPGACSAAA